MPRRRDTGLGAIKERQRLQTKITERFGEKAILKARKRLCENCVMGSCFLFPITTEGKDCPYFKQKEAKE